MTGSGATCFALYDDAAAAADAAARIGGEHPGWWRWHGGFAAEHK
jgi:4-diphosphocytidyl-2-C-methyl-D-erythritol kinase